jgi:hypothetical protein
MKDNRKALKQRAHDKRWEVLEYMPDPTENIEDWEGREMLFPYRWVVTAVHDHRPDKY